MDFSYIQDNESRGLVKDIYYKILVHEKTGQAYASDFLNPAVQKHLKAILVKEGLAYDFIGGHENAERRILSLGQLDESPFEVLVIDDISPSIGHSDVMGAVLNTGLSRDKLGDIVFNGPRLEFALVKDEAWGLVSMLGQIKNQPVQARIKEEPVLQDSDTEDRVYKASISSMRLDALVAEMIKTSRAKGQGLVKAGKVKVNHILEKNTSRQVDLGDLISISGQGRFIVKDELGESRKGRTIIKYIKKG